MSPALLILAFAVFAMGTAEFIISGLAPIMAAELGVPVSSIGLLVTFFSLGLMLGPLSIGMLTRALKSKPLLITLLAIFIGANLMGALTNILAIIFFMRFIMGVCFGIFIGIAINMAANIAPAGKQTKAISFILFGFVIALVAGVPFGRWMGELFNWESTFLLIAFLAGLSLLGTIKFLPNSTLTEARSISWKAQFGVFKSIALIKIFIISFCSMAAFACIFTYIAPFLQEVAGFNSKNTSFTILCFGIAGGIGNLAAGKIGDSFGSKHSLTAGLAIFTATLMLLKIINIQIMTFFLFMVLALITFAISPLLYSRIIDVAENYYKAGSAEMASGINISIISLGIALGAFWGGLVMDGFGLGYIPIFAASLVFIALILSFGSPKKYDFTDTFLPA